MLSNLPELPDGLSWSFTGYTGNYDDGVYREGERILVSIRRHGKFLFWNTNFQVDGVIALIVDPRQGDANIMDAVQKVYASYLDSLTRKNTEMEL